MAAVAKAQVSLDVTFCSVRGFESGRGQKYECNFFLYRLFHIFFLMKYKGGILKPCRQFFLTFLTPYFQFTELFPCVLVKLAYSAWQPAGFEGVISISSVLSIMKPDIRILRPKTFQCKKAVFPYFMIFFNWNMSALKNFENHDNNFTHRIQKSVFINSPKAFGEF